MIIMLEALAHAVCADAAQVPALVSVNGLQMLIDWFTAESSPAVSPSPSAVDHSHAATES
jgi:hypothetical protein